MKKILLSIIAITTLYVGNAQIVNIPDANFKAYLVSNSSINTNSDSEIQVSEASAFTGTIYAQSLGITDLTGIEAFTYLTDLRCYDNSLTSLDLSQNGFLSSLNCRDNQLSRLNVKNGYNGFFTYFNAINNPSLTCITVDNVAYSTTLWTNIDSWASFSTNCYTYVPDDNFETYLEANGMGNGIANDDYVTTANINTVTILNVSALNIADLTGIENFTALTDLRCSNNNLTSLDVTANTALTELRCFRNYTISTLDISTNTNLIELYCDNNSLTSLDVSANTNLTTLWCDDNSLTSLDVSANTVLTSLKCDNNSLINLDVSANTNLTRLWCNNNSLSTLDISANTALTRLYCNDNSLSTLTATQNTSLTFLLCQNNQLTYLDVKNSNNTNMLNANFDTTNNPSLTCIEVDDAAWSTTNWTNIDAAASFSENCPLTYVPDDNFEQALINLGYDTVLDNYVLTANIIGITSLNLYSEGISDLSGIEAFEALTQLWCHNNSLSSLDISANTALTFLNCDNNNISSLNLSVNTLLSDLRCQNNSLGNLDLSANTDLITLMCFNNQLTNLDLSANTLLTSLRCQDNSLTSLDVKNGNNINFTYFDTTNNPSLTCIEVDNATWSTTNWTNIDATSSFSENCTLSINEFNLENISIYPNPTQNRFRIEGLQENSQLEIYSLTGQLVLKQTSYREGNVDVSNLSSSVYFVKITNSKGSAIKRLIRE